MKLTYDQLTDFIAPIKDIDWPLLHRQKEALAANLLQDTRERTTLLYREELMGLLHLLDALGEAAETAGLWQHPALTTAEATKENMTIEKLIAIADNGYQGDKLAIFIANELRETFDPNDDSAGQLCDAMDIVEKVQEKISGSLAALNAALAAIVTSEN